jgi:hypothetical protein
MTFNKNTIAATFAAVVIGGLTISPVSAAAPVYGWSDISAVTHEGSTASGVTQIGQTSGEYGRNDVSALTNGSLPMGVKPLAKASVNGYSRNDISAITHN